ncbi:hypothetical protein B7P43_G17660 [Cryptotermes secundus]|uniref:HAT C-terminal dimerisation domain-containing protein n=1 Tax=Cryptotermes secundus TaxID=105785 RepID=A0A2J7Q093_9NEOP|nr:hypothetical protein B7P43_G17660 [Cryptotermes secundus]
MADDTTDVSEHTQMVLVLEYVLNGEILERLLGNARIFFSNILSIPTFFSRSPHPVSILKMHMEVSIPRPSSRRWNFNIRTINRVRVRVTLQLTVSQSVCLGVEPHWMKVTVLSMCSALSDERSGLSFVSQSVVICPLSVFTHIYSIPISYINVQYLHGLSFQASVFKFNEYTTNFITAILELRNSKYCENPSKTLMAEAKEVRDCICVDIMGRYSSTKHLVAAKLFNKKCKSEYPTEEIVLTTETYPMIDKEKLETELKVFYCRSDIHEYCTLIELLKFILENNIDDVFSEITKLIKLLLTVPMTTSEAERCFSTLKRITTFLRSAMNSERLNALAVLSMEKNFLSCHPEIKEKISDLFS